MKKDRMSCGCYPEGDPVKWNPYNEVVQCHKCGESYFIKNDVSEIARLTSQNAELLAALKDIVSSKDVLFECTCIADNEDELEERLSDSGKVWDNARAAIAKIEADK